MDQGSSEHFSAEHGTFGHRHGERYRAASARIIEKIGKVIHEGNIRRMRVEHQGRTILEVPLTVVAIGALIAPDATILGAVAALATGCSMSVDQPAAPATEPPTKPGDDEAM